MHKEAHKMLQDAPFNNGTGMDIESTTLGMEKLPATRCTWYFPISCLGYSDDREEYL